MPPPATACTSSPPPTASWCSSPCWPRRLAPRLRNLAESATRRRILQAYIFAPLLLLAIDALELPVSLYGHHLSLKFEQSIQGWGSWFWDWTKGELLTFALAGIAIWVLYGAMRRSPRRWWFYFWLAAVPMVDLPDVHRAAGGRAAVLQVRAFGRHGSPRWSPRSEKVTARGGLEIPPGRMFEMNASQKLKSLNAYVTGIGASKRVVVWDTTIQKMDTGQTLFVFGHEMGHYVLGHVWIGIGAALLGILVFLFLAYSRDALGARALRRPLGDSRCQRLGLPARAAAGAGRSSAFSPSRCRVPSAACSSTTPISTGWKSSTAWCPTHRKRPPPPFRFSARCRSTIPIPAPSSSSGSTITHPSASASDSHPSTIQWNAPPGPYGLGTGGTGGSRPGVIRTET
jgi:Zn-dependent protease with chaperone function